MYSTIDGAKKCAKELKRLFDNSGLDFALNKCQSAVARAGGYRDWHDLEGALGRAPHPVEPLAFRKRLLTALPEPCRPPALAWLDKEPAEEAPAPDTPPRWYRDVFPYLMATAALHRNRTPLLRPGSGAGQRLREALVVGLLLNLHGGRRVVPRLEPDSLALVFRGDAATLFRDDFCHPRFEAELATLAEAGILDVREDRVRVLSPNREAVVAHVADSRAGKAQHWGEEGGAELANALRDALASIGVRNALRVAGAIANQGSDAYNTPSGPVLDLLSELAEEGEVETFAKAYGLFASIRPANAMFVREAVPAKISSRYLARHRQLSPSKIMSWANAHPEWPETLKEAVAQPAMFVMTVDAVASAIAEHSA
ncbi:hypothetical protein [Methylobacterium brachiatum]|uniref:hypothetical protein n=2 Tax=Pseudomonadota TaxID=1224 RepID=UPI0008EFA661|nr:hypothetical protein [Methylobacterium brachiatum]SFH92422.1 hypothetical protein SAMN02799642_00096 [Methylobacterium brachiatum]